MKDKEILRSLFALNVRRNSRMTTMEFEQQGDTAIYQAKEENDLITRLGLDGIYYDETRTTFQDGLVQEVKLTMSPASEEAFDRQFNAFSTWLAENRPDE